MSKVKIFVQPDGEFTISIFASETEDQSIFCETSLEGLKKLSDEIKDENVEEINLTFKKPSFGDSIELHKSIFSLSGEGTDQVDFNPIAIRFKKIKTLIKSWNIKDDEGNIVPISDGSIKLLNPTIAGVIGIKIDAETGGLLS